MDPKAKDKRDVGRFHEYRERAAELMSLLVEICNLDKKKLRHDIGSAYLLFLIKEKGSIIDAYEFIDASLEKLKAFKDAGISLTKEDVEECLKMTKGE